MDWRSCMGFSHGWARISGIEILLFVSTISMLLIMSLMLSEYRLLSRGFVLGKLK